VNCLVDVLEDPFSVHLVLEYIEGEDLLDYMLEAGCLTEETAADIIRQLLQALAHVHEHKIVHRDIKPENVMIHGSLAAPRVTLIDFGLAQSIGLTPGKGVEGTLPYLAPEAFEESHRCEASLDLWSVGVVLFAMLTSELPSNANSYGSMVDNLTGRVSEGAQSFLRGLLVPKEFRMSAEEALEHEWLK
jgi:serine/threonine protein kinase